jgi:hypothetical protein
VMFLQPLHDLVAVSLQRGHFFWVGKVACCGRPQVSAMVAVSGRL